MIHGARWAGIFLAAIAPGIMAGCAKAPAPAYSISWTDGDNPAVTVAGVDTADLRRLESETRTPEQWAALLSVHVEQPESEAKGRLPSMLGSWNVQGESLRFQPQYPFAHGVRYRAEFFPAQLPGATAGNSPVIAYFQLPAALAQPDTVVTQIYPTADVLPKNQLKFYVQFSAPMSRGDIYRHIHLRDAAGREADLPFLDIDEELWDPAMTRLTLLVDPGRIKRGVQPLEDLGPVFEDGKTYSLTLDAAWQDATGRPLRETYKKEFRIGPPDRTPPDPARWTMRAPTAGTREPLVVEFDEPMDRALSLRLITVASASGATLPGETTLGEHERRWSFVPAQPWQTGAHKLMVGTTIEDLAGNNIGKVFDVDVFEDVQRRLVTETATVPFEVK